ncbi:MAG: type II secretion system protein GspL [Gammaproteobacteria bacterium]
MPETLVLRMPSISSSQPTWMVVDVAGTRIGSVEAGSLADVREAAQLRRLCVLLPSDDCLVSHSELPLKNQQKLLQALPFSFEDQLIARAEELHFAAGQRNEQGQFVVAAVQRSALDQVLEELTANELAPQQVIPVDAALPVTLDGCTVLLEADEAMLRTASGDAVSMTHDSLVAGLMLAASQRDSEQPMPVTVYIDDASGESGERATTAIHDEYEHAEFRRLPEGSLSKLAVESLSPSLPNLLQGDYAPSTSYDKLLTPWKPAAIAAAVLMALMIGYKAVEFGAMKSRLTELNAAMQELAKETFPQRQRFPDPAGMFRAEMRDSGNTGQTGRSEFIEYIHTIASVSKDVTGLDVRRMNFRPGNLDLEVVAPSVQSLDGFTTQISADSNIDANLTSTKANGDTIQGRVQLKRGQP